MIHAREVIKLRLLLKLVFTIFFMWLSQNSLHAQLIKKTSNLPPTKLDKTLISDHFSFVSLHEVYQTFIRKYNISISYDSGYCKKKYFSYWFWDTPLSRAIEITTRETGVSYEIDSGLHITIKKLSGLTADMIAAGIDEQTMLQVVPLQTKHLGPANKTNFTISGKITDIITGEPLPFAIIAVKGTKNGTTTNSDGYFTLLNIPNDTVALVASYMGYKTMDYYLNPTVEIDNLQIDLMPSKNGLQEVVVSANREDLMKMSGDNLSMIKMSPAKLAELPNVGEKDIMRSFQLMPGISAANESSSGLYVRGGTPDQNLVLYDGFTVYHVDHLYGFFSAFNANALKDVQLYKGGFEAKYGGRLSSVTEITGKEGNKKNVNIGGDISLLSANIFTELPITEDLTFIAAYRRSWKGPIYNSIFKSFNNSEEEEQQPGGGGMFGTSQKKATSYFYDLNMKLTYRLGKKDVLSASFFNGTDKLDNGYKIETPSMLASMGINLDFSVNDLTKYGNLGTSLKWSRKWAKRFYSNTLISYSNYYSDRDRSSGGKITNGDGEETNIKIGTFENNNLKDISIRSDYTFDVFKRNQLEFGLFGTNYDIKYSFSESDTADILNKKDAGLLYGGYIQDKYKFWKNRIELKSGIRTSYFDVTDQWYYEPRVAAGINFTDRLSLKSSFGEFYQFANRITREDILSGSRDFWLLSDGKNIPVSKSRHYISGISYETNNWLFSVEGYYKTLSNLTEYSLRYSSGSQGVSYSENFYNGIGYSKGLEFLLQKKTGKFSGWVSYTIGEARSKFDVYSNDYFAANQDVTHEFKIVGLYKYKRWDFSTTWIYATGRPYTAPTGAYTITLLDGTTESYFTVSDKNSLRLPDYHRLDIAANYHIYNAAKKDIGYIGLSIFNAYNKANIWYKQYDVSSGQIIETDIRYLGLTPNLTISLKLR